MIVLSKPPENAENGILFSNNNSNAAQPVFRVNRDMLRFAIYGLVVDKVLTHNDYIRVIHLSKYLEKENSILLSDLACIAPLSVFETFLALSAYFSETTSKERIYYVDPIFYNFSIISTIASELSSQRAIENITLDYADFIDKVTLKVLNILLQGLDINLYLVFYNTSRALRLSTATRIDIQGGLSSIAILKSLGLERYLPSTLENIFNPGKIIINRKKKYLSIVSPLKEERVKNFLTINTPTKKIKLESIFGQKSGRILDLLRELHDAGGVALYQAFAEWAKTLSLENQDLLKLISTEYITVERYSSSLYIKLSYKGFHII